MQLSNKLPLELMQPKWAATLNPVIKNPLNNVSILKDISLLAGTNVINHLLGKTQQGWFLVDLQAATVQAGILNVYLLNTVTVTAGNPIIFDTIIDDTSSSYSTSTGLYTVQIDGFYLVEATFDSATVGASAILYKNGAQQGVLSTTVSPPAKVQSGSRLVKCVAGDTLSIQVDTTTSVTGSGNPYVTTMAINLVSNGISIYRDAPFNDKTLSLFSDNNVIASIGVF